MISALIAGKLYGAPQQRAGRNGPFMTCKVRVPTGDGGSTFVSVITFSASAIEALSALGDGDAVSIAGEATLRVYLDKDSKAQPALDLVGHQVLTVYHAGKRRKAMQSDQERPPANGRDDPQPDLSAPAATSTAQPTAAKDFDDDIPF